MVNELQDIKEVQFLYEICSLLIKSQDNKEIFTEITEKFCEYMELIACSIWQVNSQKGMGQQRIGFFQLDHDSQELLPTLDYRTTCYVIQERKALLCQDVQEMDHVARRLPQDLRITAYPLYINGELIGVLNCWCIYREHPFCKVDRVVHQLTNELAHGMYNCLFRSDIQQKRLKKELDIAQRMQLSLTPKEIPHIKGISIAARTLMAHEVGGDYVDLFLTKGNNLGIAIGDVMGKGIPAALWASIARATLRMAARDDRQPHLVIGDVNNTLFQDLSSQGTFLTLMSAWYEPLNRTLLFSNAGHLNPVLIQTSLGKHKILKARGPYIGGIENHPYQLGGIRLQAGDIVFFYTDGLSETINAKDNASAINHIVEIIKYNSFYRATEIIDKIYLHLGQIMGEKPQHDDISLILLKIES